MSETAATAGTDRDPESRNPESRTARYSGTSPAAAASISTVVLVCRPKRGSRRKPATRLPATAPAVFAKYSTPARRPTDCSTRWIMRVARAES